MVAPILSAGICLAVAQNLHPYLLEEATFSISFPAPPERKTVLLPTSADQKLPAITYRAEHHFLDFYLVFHECEKNLTNPEARAVLLSARDHLIAAISGTLLSSREIVIDGVVALEFEVEYLDSQEQKKRILERTCLANRKFYQIMVIGNPTLMRTDAPSDFLQSFTLTGTATK